MRLAAGRLIAALATIAVVGVVVVALRVVGSPAAERLRRADGQRLNDLQAIAAAVDVYLTRNHELPADLSTADRAGMGMRLVDPVTERPYDYRRIDGTAYELCATFDTAETTPQFWAHPAGRQCYRLLAKVIERP